SCLLLFDAFGILVFFSSSFFFLSICVLRDLPSFPTRRSSDLDQIVVVFLAQLFRAGLGGFLEQLMNGLLHKVHVGIVAAGFPCLDRKSTRLNSSHVKTSYAVFCLKKKRFKEATE